MADRLVSIAQLDRAYLPGSEKSVLRTVLARGHFGDVKVWSSHQMSWVWASNDPDVRSSSGEFIDLIVLGEPKAIATKLVTELAYDKGLFEAPISMTLAQAINWAHQWNQSPGTEKVDLLDQLYWMRERAYQCLHFDRYHFSVLLVEDLIGVIDQAIKAGNWLCFMLNIDRLHDHEEMKFDPYSGLFEPDSR
jgi:hypothetical protein